MQRHGFCTVICGLLLIATIAYISHGSLLRILSEPSLTAGGLVRYPEGKLHLNPS